MIILRLYPKLTIYCHVADMDYPSPALCYGIYLMSLIWITTSLSYDGEGMVNRTGHDGGYDCLCLPWVIDGMTQLLTKINGPYSDMLLHKTMYGGIFRNGIFARFDWPLWAVGWALLMGSR